MPKRPDTICLGLLVPDIYGSMVIITRLSSSCKRSLCLVLSIRFFECLLHRIFFWTFCRCTKERQKREGSLVKLLLHAINWNRASIADVVITTTPATPLRYSPQLTCQQGIAWHGVGRRIFILYTRLPYHSNSDLR